MKQNKQLQIIKGLITASDWDENGSPIEVKICSSGEVDYVVKRGSKGDRLLSRIREFVIVEGAVAEVESRRTIEVKTILSKT